MENKNSKHSLLLGLILFRLSLDFLYVFVLSNYYQKSILLSRGIFIYDFNLSKYLISILLFYGLSLFLVFKVVDHGEKASELFLLGLFLISYTPAISLYGLANLNSFYLVYLHVFWIILIVSVFIFKGRKSMNIIKKSRKKLDDESRYLLWQMIIFLSCLGVFLIAFKYNGLRLKLNFDTDSIYELRISARSYDMNKFVDYFRNNAMYIIFPFLGILVMKKKKIFLFLVVIYFQLLLYSIDNQKAALFILPASVLVYIFYRNKYFFRIPFLLIGINCLIFIEFISGKSDFLIKSLLERIYYLPSILGNGYFEFFLDSPPVIPFSSIFVKIGFVSEYAYGEGIAYILGLKFFNTSAISANTGIFGSAMSYGILGIVLVPIFYALLFKWFDKVTSNLETRIYISILIIQVYVITNVSIFVVVSSYGFILALFMLSLLNNNTKFSIEQTNFIKSQKR